MKKIKRRPKMDCEVSLIPIKDAQTCPRCGIPFPVSIRQSPKEAPRYFMCLFCERTFEKTENGLVWIAERNERPNKASSLVSTHEGKGEGS